MINLSLLLLGKITVVLIVAFLTAWAMRTRSAAARHLLWFCTTAVLLILPLGIIVPDRAVPAPLLLRLTSAGGSDQVMFNDDNEIVVICLIGVWAVGALCLLASVFIGWYRATRLAAGGRLVGRFDGYSICEVSSLASPAAWSFGPGTILLPAGAEHWPQEQFQAAVRHEAAHIERRDCQALLVAELACSLYWFHPLVWYAARRLRQEQEHAADDAVLHAGIGADEYASALIGITKFGCRQRLLSGVGTVSLLGARVKAVLDVERKRTMLSRRMVLASVAAVLAVSGPVVGMQAKRGVYKVGDGVTPPEILYKEEPQYTEAARDAKLEGSVLLSAVIESDGIIDEVSVERSLDAGLDNNAMEAVRKWRFKPAEKDGKPVAVGVRIEVNFRLI